MQKIEIVEDKEDEYSEDYTEDTRMSYIDLVKEIARYIIGEGFSSLGDFFVPVFNKYIRNMIDRWMKVRRDAKNEILLDTRVGGIMSVMGVIRYVQGNELNDFIFTIMKSALIYINDREVEPDVVQGCFYSFKLLFVYKNGIGKQLLQTYPSLVVNWINNLNVNPMRKYLEDSYENAVSSILHMLDANQHELAASGQIDELWKFVLLNLVNFKQDLEEIEDCLIMLCMHLNMNDRFMLGNNNCNMALIIKALVMLIASNSTRYGLKKTTIATVLNALKTIYRANESFFVGVVNGIDNPIVLADLEQIMK